MEQRQLDGKTFRRMLQGGAYGIRNNIKEINDLNVFPVPDGDTGTNMSKTIESGIAKIPADDNIPLSTVAKDFSKGSLFGARGNSGVILSQFFAGMCEYLNDKETATAEELAEAYLAGVKRSYRAVANPVEGTILTVFRESAEYAVSHIDENCTVEALLKLNIEEAERSLERTKEILPVLTEADVVDSGGAGYLCIAKGMYDSLVGGQLSEEKIAETEKTEEVDYDDFTSESQLEFGYCTECLVRLQTVKVDVTSFNAKDFASELEKNDCNSIVALCEGDILKVHAHTFTPSIILDLCQKYGEFLNVKIENMSLQHSEKVKNKENPEIKTAKKPHKRYAVVTVATGDGMKALFESLGADYVINGGQTGNPSAEQFLEAFESLNADDIFVLPNNGNILLTAIQASELWSGANVTVIPTKTLPEGYAALSVFNPAVEDVEEQISDMLTAKNGVRSGEITAAIRDTKIDGVDIKCGEYLGILDGDIVTSDESVSDAICNTIEKIDDLDDREILTLFVGSGVSEEERAEMTELLEDRFDNLSVEVFVGGQEIYDYLLAVE